jgi:GntR family transcriptional regulator/MocR family aminotransferase
VPLAEQICDAVRAAVEQGRLQRGVELPSTRALARELGISRNTVIMAYEELRAMGLITSVQGSRTRVTGGGKLPGLKRLRELVKGSGYPSKARVAGDPDSMPIMVYSSAGK